MTDSLKERLRDPANHCPDNMGCNCAPVCMCALNDEALARIEELETDIKDYAYNLDNFRYENDQLQATIAKLEGENKRLTLGWAKDANEYERIIITTQGKLDRAIESAQRILSRTDVDVATMPEHDLIRFCRREARSILSDLSPDGGKGG